MIEVFIGHVVKALYHVEVEGRKMRRQRTSRPYAIKSSAEHFAELMRKQYPGRKTEITTRTKYIDS